MKTYVFSVRFLNGESGTIETAAYSLNAALDELANDERIIDYSLLFVEQRP